MTLAPGRALEAAVASFFEANGYTVELNAVEVGRSGARHEIDVLARKADGVISLTIGVECKDWAEPVTKEVVAKASAVFTDLGFSNGVVVAAGGWTAGAGQLARQLGLEMWGPAEMATRKIDAQSEPADPHSAPGRDLGWPLGIEKDEGLRILGKRGKRGRFPFKWEGVVWLPVWLLQTSLAAPEGAFRKHLVREDLWLMTDAFAGVVAERVPGIGDPTLELVVPGSVRLPAVASAQTSGTRLANKLVAALAGGVRAKLADPQIARILTSLGRRALHDGASLTMGEARRAFMPLFAACLEANRGVRFLAIDGRTGKALDGLEDEMAHAPAAMADVGTALLDGDAGRRALD